VPNSAEESRVTTRTLPDRLPGAREEARRAPGRHKGARSPYPYWFYLPAAVIYTVLFLLPTFASFYFSLTRWSLFDYKYIGLANFISFFQEPALVKGFVNTLIYAAVTSGLKVVLGLPLAMLLTSRIIARGYLRSVVFFPVLVSTIGVGITFTALMNPQHGLINDALSATRRIISRPPGVTVPVGWPASGTSCCRWLVQPQ
jgi:raffinose/stachyose/melibiose transport system permease protein